MTIGERIVEALKTRPDGVDDDELTKLLQLTARQQANTRCRSLEKQGLVARRPVNGKIRNFWIDGVSLPNEILGAAPTVGVKPWFWEGNVQQAIVNHLTTRRYLIRSVADTAGRQRGVDVIAERLGRPLWISVKGYPVGTVKTRPSLQASHWFKQVIFDVLAYRGLNSDFDLGVGLPDFRRYRDMAQKIDWFKPIGSFSYFWVREGDDVLVE